MAGQYAQFEVEGWLHHQRHHQHHHHHQHHGEGQETTTALLGGAVNNGGIPDTPPSIPASVGDAHIPSPVESPPVDPHPHPPAPPVVSAAPGPPVQQPALPAQARGGIEDDDVPKYVQFTDNEGIHRTVPLHHSVSDPDTIVRVCDPYNEKVYEIPLQFTERTSGRETYLFNRSGRRAQVCMRYQQGRCNMREKCQQIHVDLGLIRALRDMYQSHRKHYVAEIQCYEVETGESITFRYSDVEPTDGKERYRMMPDDQRSCANFVLCPNFLSTGECPNGRRCQMIHVSREKYLRVKARRPPPPGGSRPQGIGGVGGLQTATLVAVNPPQSTQQVILRPLGGGMYQQQPSGHQGHYQQQVQHIQHVQHIQQVVNQPVQQVVTQQHVISQPGGGWHEIQEQPYPGQQETVTQYVIVEGPGQYEQQQVITVPQGYELALCDQGGGTSQQGPLVVHEMLVESSAPDDLAFTTTLAPPPPPPGHVASPPSHHMSSVPERRPLFERVRDEEEGRPLFERVRAGR